MSDKYVCWVLSSRSLDWCNNNSRSFYDCSWEHVDKSSKEYMLTKFNEEVEKLKLLPYNSIVTLKKETHEWKSGIGISSFPNDSIIVEKVSVNNLSGFK